MHSPEREFFPIFSFQDFETVKDAFVALVFFIMFMIWLLELLYVKGSYTTIKTSYKMM